ICIYRSILFFRTTSRASKRLHDQMFYSILHAPMRFFDLNPSGRILNRFSKDMGAIDEIMPRVMMEAIQIILVMLGILAVIVIVNPPMIFALSCAIVLFALIIKLYLRPSQDLKRLEGICRSPVFSHLTATINGLATIRARNIQNKLANEFDHLQDVHSAVWQLAMTSNTACGLWMDCISTAFVASVTFSFIIFYENTFSGNVGLAISQALILTGMVQYGIRQATETMQQMTSVERILQYTDLEPEQSPDEKPPSDWPRTGKIKMHNMSLRYDPQGPPILKNLRLEIESGFKVGVVGRTGAGKSSLIGALFRLAHVDGIIEIDNINTGTIALSSLREKISIIPQDPVLFSHTVRYNLDPFGHYTDDAMWRSLEDVELKSMIESLDYFVTEGGTNFSQGQRQLICLARAILRNNKVLVLDEATANVDPQTDALIQKTIREKFKQFTVITVAHRLHTIMDSDRVLVMDAGIAKEYDIPHNLLQNEESIFRGMVDATGPQESEQLKKVAAQKFSEIISPSSSK
ncbi:ATP-binding cassette sub-family C member 4-like, partial [Sitodiplosis mosellana]|uniref:ATP-binding cassette sub-family C member 4-like n=2 Tax=Sitodiplosis mosellana TaxID=263140 RepID=UPI002444BC8C